MSSNVKNITQTAIFTAVLCVISPLTITLPVSPVPISLATFAVYLFSIILGVKKSFMGLIVYILIGIVGLPVFSNGGSGAGVVLGPTGGYLIGYFFCSLGSSLGYELGKKLSESVLVKITVSIAGMVMGTFFCYTLGTMWLSYLNKLTFDQALAAGVIPFIPADTAKIIIAGMAAVTLRERLKAFM